MKKLIVSGLFTIGLIVGNVALVGAPQNTAAQEANDSDLKERLLPGAVIDGIEIPYEVLRDIEAEYPGHAVIKATKLSGSDERVYRLSVRRDTNALDYQGFYLFYDKDWELVDDKKLVPPKPKPEPADTKKEAKEEQDEAEQAVDEDKPLVNPDTNDSDDEDSNNEDESTEPEEDENPDTEDDEDTPDQDKPDSQ